MGNTQTSEQSDQNIVTQTQKSNTKVEGEAINLMDLETNDDFKRPTSAKAKNG
jgi:hypothetical protein